MAKNRNRPQARKAAPPPPPPVRLQTISRLGWRVVTAGAGAVAFGFYLLSLTDPAGRNWASVLSPFALLGGYAVVAVGIALPERPEAAPVPVQTRP